MLRSDRSLVEKYFAEGLIKVLCCTATLAWGVNLPAHAVVIKGTQLYNAQQGSFVDLGILDVQQVCFCCGVESAHAIGFRSSDVLVVLSSILREKQP